jgi:hypothetical protein
LRGVSKDEPPAFVSILRLAAKCGEHLRMTVEYFRNDHVRRDDGEVTSQFPLGYLQKIGIVRP